MKLKEPLHVVWMMGLYFGPVGSQWKFDKFWDYSPQLFKFETSFFETTRFKIPVTKFSIISPKTNPKIRQYFIKTGHVWNLELIPRRIKTLLMRSKTSKERNSDACATDVNALCWYEYFGRAPTIEPTAGSQPGNHRSQWCGDVSAGASDERAGVWGGGWWQSRGERALDWGSRIARLTPTHTCAESREGKREVWNVLAALCTWEITIIALHYLLWLFKRNSRPMRTDYPSIISIMSRYLPIVGCTKRGA